MASFITVDYDFFPPHEMYKEVEFPDGKTAHGMFVYDWQMCENRAPLFDAVIWETRCTNFKRWGLDIVARTAPTLSVEDFANRVSAQMDDYSSPNLWRSDSHAWAGILAKDYAGLNGPLSVVNFDSHHDLGYHPTALEPFKASGRVACDDWALIGLHEGWIENYTLVYPDWQGLAEWSPGVKKLTKDFRKRIHITTWSDWHDEIPECEVMHFCRSSAWVPPWLDEGFTKLHEEFGWAECLDCTMGQHNSPYDTCKVRDWDWKLVNENIAQRIDMIAAVELLQ